MGRIEHFFFVDFDETLFNHRLYVEWLSGFLQNTYEIDTKEYVGAFDEYHDVQDTHGILRLYRHKEHLRDKTGLSWDVMSAVIEQEIMTSKLHFCYEDAHQLLEEAKNTNIEHIRLLTYGDESYQRFKIGLCPVIRAFPVHVVMKSKKEFLQENFTMPSMIGLLIDDKAPLNLPSNWNHMWINRDTKNKKVYHGENVKIRNLDFKNIVSQSDFAGTID